MLLRSSPLSSVYFNPLRSPDDPVADPPDDPVADPPVTDPPATDPPAGDSGEQPDPAAAAAPPSGLTPEQEIRWRDRQLARQHRRGSEREAELARLRQENEDLRAIATRAPKKDGDEDPEPAPRTPAPVNRDEVHREAARLVAKDNYDRDCNAMFVTGKKAYPDWDQTLTRLSSFGTKEEPAIDIDTMVVILATDDPAKVLHELGSNPDEYDRVMALPPARRNNEFAKLALKAAPKKKVSDAPAPVDPVQGRGGAVNDDLDDKLSDDEWARRRIAQKRKSEGRPWSLPH